MISTFNLTPLATGMTGQDGHKTLRFYQLVRLVTSCLSLLVLKYKEIVLFRALICVFSATLTIGYADCNLLFLNRFLLSWSVSYVRLRCGTVSVCRLLLGEFLEPYRELVRLVCLVVLKCNGIVCLLMLYSKLVAIGTTSF